MKIVTINVPESYIDAMKKLVGGEHGLYPSRSELIRCAVREFLLKELKLADSMTKYSDSEVEIDDFDHENFVRIPIESVNEKSEPVKTYKPYKILRKLEFNSNSLETSNKASKKKDDETRSYKKKDQRRLGNPFWEDKGTYKISIENPDIVYIQGIGNCRKDNLPIGFKL